MSATGLMEKDHPHEPHWYLNLIGVEPSAQGHGGGSALLAHTLERCDAEGLPAYLDSNTERSIPLYQRHGFEVTEEVRLPRGGPPFWRMWRERRA
jgi:GNAT superfamily N-acetyltransferase